MKNIIALLSLLTLSACYTTQDGEKVGTITKLSKQGIIFNTWEGQIIRGGLNGGSGGFGSSFEFTVEDMTVLAKMQLAMENQKEVKIHYHKEAICMFWRSETSGCYFIDSVQTLN